MKEKLIVEQPEKINIEEKSEEKEMLLTEQPVGDMELIQEQEEQEQEKK